MNTLFLGIVIFLIVLAVFDLVVGVSNDAVNFLNSAIGAKVARYRTVVSVAAIGVFAGAALSNGMMDVARHGIMTPQYFSFYDVMCVFLAVMITDVVLLDVFNTLGMPTSTTVSMVFELLGGAFAIALLQILHGATAADGTLLSLGDLLNTEKAISVILGIFLSVAIAFVLGMLVQWVARVVFTFTYRVNGRTTDQSGKMGSLVASSLKIGIFGGLSVTAIVWFLLINGLKSSSLMTPELKEMVSQNTLLIIGGGAAVFSVLLTLLSAMKLPVLKFVVLLGTFALAMAFAGNDLVNFVGVPLTGLEAYQDYMANGNGESQDYMMYSLMDSAHTPALYLIAAGVVMVLALVFSKKAQNVVKTSVDLSRQDEGDEMFGSSGVARTLVRTSRNMANGMASVVPNGVARWIDSRFNADAAVLKRGAAFDEIRAAVNLVLAGALVALGTSLKLPLSTTYVTFMVAMGASLADRAWSRESAVFRITGVLSVIGGWFITAGVAFMLCFLVCIALFFGSFVAMAVAIALAIFLLIRSHLRYEKSNKTSEADELFDRIVRSSDKAECWILLRQHVALTITHQLQLVAETYKSMTDAFFYEDYRTLKRTAAVTENQRKDIKRQRRKQIMAQRRIDPMLSIEKGTWYFLTINSLAQMVYCLKRMGEPCLEHVGNNFSPVPSKYIQEFIQMRNEILQLFNRACHAETMALIRGDAEKLQSQLSDYRRTIIHDIQAKQLNIESMTVFLNLVQESQQLLSALRHTVRGANKFDE
ncbi:MAG: inorganic phosphate transporter [Bacteroidales bacterium]|nr:inorganic phosphate transporter [Bacteroidales bacterium]MBR4705328.1 inorganic phosphate transporter [Paludibacteraceae bacterium]MBR5990151.1 inorganic phosphate transporter [Prevotella sp.]